MITICHLFTFTSFYNLHVNSAIIEIYILIIGNIGNGINLKITFRYYIDIILLNIIFNPSSLFFFLFGISFCIIT